MRTLSEIMEAAKSNEPLTIEEARYSICALAALSHFDVMGLHKLYEAEKEGKKPFLTRSAVYQADESHKRWHIALNKSPKEYVGESYDPANPEYQKRRKISQAIWDKVAAKGVDNLNRDSDG